MSEAVVLETLRATPILPIIVIDDAARAHDTALALLDGGIPHAEVTLRTPDAFRALEAMARVDGFCVGAGTVLDADSADLCVAAGAQFIVTPGWSDAVHGVCHDLGVTLIPGTATPTEMMRARDAGHVSVKVYPSAQLGGSDYLRAVSAPLHDMTFIPSGGVSREDVGAYLELPAVSTVGVSWIATRKDIATRDLRGIEMAARDAVALARAARS